MEDTTGAVRTTATKFVLIARCPFCQGDIAGFQTVEILIAESSIDFEGGDVVAEMHPVSFEIPNHFCEKNQEPDTEFTTYNEGTQGRIRYNSIRGGRIRARRGNTDFIPE